MAFKVTKAQNELIAGLIKSGRFNNRSEVVRAGLRMLEDSERSRPEPKPVPEKTPPKTPDSKHPPAKDAARVPVQRVKTSQR